MNDTKIITHALALGNMDNFIYIIENKITKEAVIIDPAWEVDFILDYLSQHSLDLKAILLTHTHYDHIDGVDGLVNALSDNLPVYVSHKDDNINAKKYNRININDDAAITVANLNIKTIATAGHTKECVCFLVDNNIFTGDTLFVNGCERCNFPSSNINDFFESIQKLKALPNETKIHTGHNYGNTKTSTIGEQKLTNPFMIIDDKDFFIKFRMKLHADYRTIPFQNSNKKEMFEIKNKKIKKYKEQNNGNRPPLNKSDY